MSMHLHHPSLSLNGKKKGRVKFRNSQEAQKARELEESWKEMKSKWAVEEEQKRRKRAFAAPALKYVPKPPPGRETKHIPSLNSGADFGAAVLKESPQYTGTRLKGIGVMHKSNLVPIFSDDEAKEISRMRR